MRLRCWWLGCRSGPAPRHWICARCTAELYSLPRWIDPGARQRLRWQLYRLAAPFLEALGAIGKRLGLCSCCGLHRARWIEETGLSGFLCRSCETEAREADREDIPF